MAFLVRRSTLPCKVCITFDVDAFHDSSLLSDTSTVHLEKIFRQKANCKEMQQWLEIIQRANPVH